MTDLPGWAKVTLTVLVFLNDAVNVAVHANKTQGAGRAFICPVGCFESGGLCYCESPAEVLIPPQVNPPIVTPVYPPKARYVCQPGCVENNALCFCTFPAMIASGTGEPRYLCAEGCSLQFKSCICISPAQLERSDFPVPPPFPRPTPRPTSLTCKESCVELNGLCFCIENPAVVEDTIPLQYRCSTNCVLNRDSNTCTCFYPATEETAPHTPKPTKKPRKRFEMFYEQYNWFGADQECRKRGRQLVQIRSRKKQKAVERFLKKKDSPSRIFTGGVWMSSYDWTWVYLEKPFTYKNWKDGIKPGPGRFGPHERIDDYTEKACMTMESSGSQHYVWTDGKCQDTYMFVCELRKGL